MIRFYCFILGFCFLVVSCANDTTPRVDNVIPKINISHFDHVFFDMDSNNLEIELLDLEERFPLFFSDSQSDEMIISRYYDPEMRELEKSVDSVFAETESLEAELYEAFQYFYHYFPSSDSMEIYTWISNFEYLDPIVVSGNTILVSLDMYLGKESQFYQTAPDYLKESFDKDYLSSDVFYHYFSQHIPHPRENTLLASMLYYGKIYYLCDLILPNLNDHYKIAYTAQQFDWCNANEGLLWASLIDQNVLFSTDAQNKQRFIDEAPFSKFYSNFDLSSPGRVGRWLGWQIIKSYTEGHPEISLIELMHEQDAQKLLRESRYKPKH